MELKAYLIQEKELCEIKKIENFNVNGCSVYVEGKKEPYRFHNYCTNDEVYLLATYNMGGEMIKLSDQTKFTPE